MTLADIREQFAYHNWANARLCTMMHDTFGDEINLHKSYSAVVLALHETAVHLVGAEQIWRTRIEGTSPNSMIAAADFPTVADLRKAFETERAKTQTLLDSLQNDADLERIIAATSTKGEPRVFPLRVLLLHILNHSTYHRGQITARLIDLGHDEHIISTDLTTFSMEHAAQ